MMIKPVKIGNLQTENNLFLAPLAGFTDFAFRGICGEFGAGLTVTEMVSAKGLIYGNKGNAGLIQIHESEKLSAVQLFGEDPTVIRRACESEELSEFKIVDINMGCPVPKIFNNGEGSALIDNPKRAEQVVSEAVKSGKIITVKTRIGLTDDKIVVTEFAKRMEGAGASLICIHGRTRKAVYSGEVNFKEIASAKNAVNIPVIANGGVFCEQDAFTLLEKTGADGIALGRGALSKPWLFSTIAGKQVKIDLYEIVSKHLDGLCTYYPDTYVATIFRKIMPYYLKNLTCSKELKHRFCFTKTVEEVKTLLKQAILEQKN